MSAPAMWGLLVSHWRLNPAPTAAAILAATAYLWGAARARGRWAPARSASFLTGVGAVVLAVDSGIDAYGERLLSVHMVQHMLLLLLAPPLLLLGRPAVLALRAAPRAWRGRLMAAMGRVRPLTHPAVCLIIFYAVLFGTHTPGFYDLTLRRALAHDGEHVLYLLAGMLLWWPMLDADPLARLRLSALLRLAYLLLAMLPMGVIGAYLDRHTSVVYAPYEAAAHRLGISALADQAQGGAIMWVIGNSVMICVGLWAVMAALHAEERRQQARDAKLLDAQREDGAYGARGVL